MISSIYHIPHWLTNSTVMKYNYDIFFHSRTVHLDIIEVLLPSDAQENFFRTGIKIYNKQLQHVSV